MSYKTTPRELRILHEMEREYSTLSSLGSSHSSICRAAISSSYENKIAKIAKKIEKKHALMKIQQDSVDKRHAERQAKRDEFSRRARC